uniref:Ig-like domain-containing protein n=1 Tax=Bactrocera latifrons TaxID=174628 RepID=A0A0K8UES7_BACLA
MPARLLTTAAHKAQHSFATHKPLNWHKDRASGMLTYCARKASAIYAGETWLRWCLVLTCLLIVPDFIAGLKDVSVTIPQAVKRGSNALLICNYDMENDTLYSIKWYKGRREFYRYTPKENPAMKVFPMAAGLNVERNLSNQSHVVLLAVPLNISGKFTCEISVEAPTFQTAMVSSELEVVELPEEQAIVTGIQPRYRIGDLVDGNCSIKYSKPAANLTWTINGGPVPLHSIKSYQIERFEESNLESVVCALNFMVTTSHFVKGQMRLKCTASIFDIFKEEIESVIEEDRPRIMASGRSYDMHNNYPYEQHGSGDGFEDHNESFLTYSAADITSSATTVHGTAASIYAKALKMHWKRLWTGLKAAAAAIQATSSLRSAPPVELELAHRYVKRISEASDDDEKESAPAAAVKNFARFSATTIDTECVAYIFIAICTSVFLCALTRHFISCQRNQRKSSEVSRAVTTPRTTASMVAAPVADFTATVLPSKVVISATTTTIARRVVNDGAASILAVKRTLKGRKSFHNCVGKNLKSLSVRLAGLPRTLCPMFMQWAKVAANPLQKLANQQQLQQQQRQQKSTSILRNQARTQRHATQQLSVTVAGRSPSTPLPATVAALTFDTPGVSAAMHAAIASCSNTSRCSGGDGDGDDNGGSNQAIGNFTKDTSKDQTLLMMIAQRFDCQHVDDLVALSHSALSKRQEQQQQQQQQQQPLLLGAIKDGKVLSKAKVLLTNWQESGVTPRPCCGHC